MVGDIDAGREMLAHGCQDEDLECRVVRAASKAAADSRRASRWRTLAGGRWIVSPRHSVLDGIADVRPAACLHRALSLDQDASRNGERPWLRLDGPIIAPDGDPSSGRPEAARGRTGTTTTTGGCLISPHSPGATRWRSTRRAVFGACL